MNKYIFLLVFLSGCFPLLSLPSMYRGINIYDRQMDTYLTDDQAREMIDYAIDKLGVEWSDMFEGYDFVFMSGYYGVLNQKGEVIAADGYTDVENKVVFIKVYKCHGDSALIHEMAHIIMGDRDHTDTEYWDEIKQLDLQMTKDLCPPDYERKRIVPQL